MNVTDDAIREVHGVTANGNRVIAQEMNDYLKIDLCGFSTANMTAYQARYLAAKLYRLSRRIRQRTEV